MTLTSEDVDRIARSGEAVSWVAERTRGWLDFWQSEIGREGFYPFDLLAAHYVLAPELFDCARTSARVGRDERLWSLWVHDPEAMLVGGGGATGAGNTEIIYCPSSRPHLHQELVDHLLSNRG